MSLQGHSKQLTLSCAAAAATPALDHPYHAAAAARAAEALLEREVMRNAAQAAAAAAAVSAAAPTVCDIALAAVPAAKYEIWFPQTAEEVEAWNAVMGLVAGMAKQRAVETVRFKEEKAERIAAEMVSAGQGEEGLTVRRQQQQYQQPPLFDGYGVAAEHLEVVVLLGLLNRSRTFCDISIRNAARVQKVSRETFLSLAEQTSLESWWVCVFLWTRRQLYECPQILDMTSCSSLSDWTWHTMSPCCKASVIHNFSFITLSTSLTSRTQFILV